jgi:transcriptional regulator with XRE-family HTH domain
MTIRAGENLKALLARVNRAAAARGKKTELAKFLGVSPQRVTNWLSFSRAPNGEITLQLLDWVRAEEVKQNENRGSAQTPPRRKARLTRSRYEKAKQSPPKR